MAENDPKRDQDFVITESASTAALASLETLSHQGYELKHPIPARVQWEPVMHCYVAYDEWFDYYGTGDTSQEALEHLAEVILEDYLDLQEGEETLSPHLRDRLHRLSRIITRNAS